MRNYERPGILSWKAATAVIRIYTKFFLHHKSKNVKLNSPYILIGNHICNMDFLHTLSSVAPDHLHFVVARKYFHNDKMKKWLTRGGAIPKSLATADVSTILAMMSVVKKGQSVGIYPAGRIGQWGVSYPIHSGTASLIKKLKIPVVISRGHGGYFEHPPYMKTPKRPGPCETEVFVGLTADQVSDMSEKEILELLNKHLYVDQYEWLEKSKAVYKGKNFAEGLENFSYRCPKCKSIHSMITKGNTLTCKNCGLSGESDFASRFKWSEDIGIENLRDWHDLILESEISEIKDNKNWTLTSDVIVATYGDYEDIHEAGKGFVRLNEEDFIFEGTFEGKEIKLDIPLKEIRYFPFESGFNFQIYIKNKLYEFRPKDGRDCARYSMCLDAIKNIKE